MFKIVVIVTGIGNPNGMHKLALLYKNIEQIRKTSIFTVDVVIFQYEMKWNIDMYRGLYRWADHVHVYKEKGRIGHFLYRYCQPSWVCTYDYVFLMLDDVELPSTFSTMNCLRLLETMNIDVLSPSIAEDASGGAHPFMYPHPHSGGFRWTNFAEYFLYMMKGNAFAQYYELLDEKTHYMWGIDLAMYTQARLRIGILDELVLQHHYSNTWTDPILLKNVKKELCYARQRLQHNNFKFVNLYMISQNIPEWYMYLQKNYPLSKDRLNPVRHPRHFPKEETNLRGSNECTDINESI